MKRCRLDLSTAAFVLVLVLGATGCARRVTRVAQGNKDQVLHFGNYAEPADLDPQSVSGVPEFRILKALFEGLVMADPMDLHPVPGVAERWDVSPDGIVYTFHLRADANWSDGEPVTADDFVQSYERLLNPALAAPYADMLYVLAGAEEYNSGELKDFSKVGVKALGAKTLQVTLRGPTPYFPLMLNHHAWFPSPMRIIDRHGSRYDKSNRWTRPGNIVSNGPFRLRDWRVHDEIVVVKNEKYWDAGKVRLKEVHFHPIESTDAEERAFRAGQLHVANTVPVSKLESYRLAQPSYLRIERYYANVYYAINVDPAKQTNHALLDPRVRRALAISIDRESLVRNVVRAGQIPAYTFVPPGPGGYESTERLNFDPPAARRLLAEAGYPGGQGLPKFAILINTLELHRAVAEAVQQMWKKELGVDVEITNQEWKVYLAAQNNLDYEVSRAAWTADYLDPSTFLDLLRARTGNNNTGYANPAFEKLVIDSLAAPDVAGICPSSPFTSTRVRTFSNPA
jgi:oligopeptide transport system substrate-binding protein